MPLSTTWLGAASLWINSKNNVFLTAAAKDSKLRKIYVMVGCAPKCQQVGIYMVRTARPTATKHLTYWHYCRHFLAGFAMKRGGFCIYVAVLQIVQQHNTERMTGFSGASVWTTNNEPAH